MTSTGAELLRLAEPILGLATAIALVTGVILGLAMIGQRFAAQTASNRELIWVAHLADLVVEF